jgi:hypothetical protein
MSKYPVWKKITLGEPWGAENLMEVFNERRYMVDPAAWEIMHTPEFTKGHLSEEQTLIRVRLSALGLVDGVGYADIFAAATNAGLALCPPELGPRLRLEYVEQPDEKLAVAMIPIVDADELACVFTIDHGDWGLGLGASCCGVSNNEDEWHASSEWIFRLPV